MDRGFEQLILLALVLLAALIDLLVRSIKKKARRAELPQAEEAPVFIEEDEAESFEPVRVEREVSPPLPSVQPVAASFKPREPPSRRGQPAFSRRVRDRSSRRWLQHRAEARRGIILMSILSPCRGLEAPRQDPS